MRSVRNARRRNGPYEAGEVFMNPSRDPEDRRVAAGDRRAIREKMLDKTLADSYPASDPPSTLPDPSEDSMLSSRVDLLQCKPAA